jgi:hypothetical protein
MISTSVQRRAPTAVQNDTADAWLAAVLQIPLICDPPQISGPAGFVGKFHASCTFMSSQKATPSLRVADWEVVEVKDEYVVSVREVSVADTEYVVVLVIVVAVSVTVVAV